jgi:aerobic carbon-monoxide dehydrogenase small subunit
MLDCGTGARQSARLRCARRIQRTDERGDETVDTVRITVNGVARESRVEASLLLVDWLRRELGLTGARTGCDTSQCGACTVLIGGMAVKSCTIFTIQADGSHVETVEGLSVAGEPGDLQAALGRERGEQCGYCIAGALMSLEGLLRENPMCSEAEVRRALEGNLCRCGAYDALVRAALVVAASRRRA